VRLDEEEPHFVIVDLFIAEYLVEKLTAGYLLEELTASRLLHPIMFILWASLFGSH
jgi:hypothetical protein